MKNRLNLHSCNTLLKILDGLSLFSVLHYAVFRFLQSTMFPFIYSDIYKTIILLCMIIVGGVRFEYICWNSIKRCNETDTKKRFFILHILIGCLSVPFVFIGLKNDYKILVFMPICVLCLYKMAPEQIFRWFVRVIAVFLLVTIICCLSGCIRNIAIVENTGNYDYKASYGICNTTDCAAYFLFLLLFIWCSRKERSWSDCLCVIAIAIIITFGTYYYTRSRTTLFCCVLCIVGIIWEQIEQGASQKKNTSSLTKYVDILTIVAFPLCALILGILTYLYGTGNAFAISVNNLLSERIRDTWTVFQKYGISIFGSVFEMHGNGGALLIDRRGYDFLDSSYAYILIRYGVVLSVIVCFIWVWMTAKVLKARRRNIAISMAIISIYALTESHLQEINYNILIAMPLCSFAVSPNEELYNKNANDKLRICPSLFGISIIGCVLLFLPYLLSWLRTVVYYKHWNSGCATFWPMVITMGFVVLLFSIWKVICFRWTKKNKAMIWVVSISVLVFGTGFVFTNGIICDYVEKDKCETELERPIIQAILDCSEQPVYAGEKSEIYQREIGGLQNHIFTTEDLCKKRIGTIIVDKNREAMPITRAGGKYIQITQTSSVYTFDSSVVEMLEAKGFTAESFYYSERKCDLYDLAQLNSLMINNDGSIVLNGKKQSITNNRYVDQETGDYEVCFRLHLNQEYSVSNFETEICVLKVVGYKGEVLIMEKSIYGADFDEEGDCTITLQYHIANAPRMEYLIEAIDGVTLYVDEIAWRRVS